MVRMPTISAKIMIKFISDQGFQQVRQKGSHKFFRHPDGRTVTVPYHKGEDLGRGIVTKILNDSECSRDDFINWNLGKRSN